MTGQSRLGHRPWRPITQALPATAAVLAPPVNAVRVLLHRIWPRQRGSTMRRAPIRSIHWWMVLAAVAAVATTTWLSTQWLLAATTKAIDTVRTTLTVGAGTGGATALLLGARRHWSGRRSHPKGEEEATERRITELYSMAIEQLGSDKAPVRLGGLYGMERLAQNNPALRQTTVDLICAYLRMPFTPPGQCAPRRLGLPRRARPGARHRHAARVPTPPGVARVSNAAQQEELQVRIAAQGVLTRHLRPGPQRRHVAIFWSDIDLNLANATLSDLDLRDCRVRTATFAAAHFLGLAHFSNSRFDGETSFDHAQFGGDVRFDQTQFGGAVSFDGARVRLVAPDGMRRVWPPGWTITPATTAQNGQLPAHDGVWGQFTKESTTHTGGDLVSIAARISSRN